MTDLKARLRCACGATRTKRVQGVAGLAATPDRVIATCVQCDETSRMRVIQATDLGVDDEEAVQ